MVQAEVALFTGRLTRLRRVRREDLPRYVAWLEDEDVRRFLNWARPLSMEEEERWFESLIGSESQHIFAIETLQYRKHIGGVGLHNIHQRFRSAEVGIFIGEKEYWGRGYGADALSLAMCYGFEQLNLHRLFLHVRADNERAIRCYRKCGFMEEGRLREAVYKDGSYYDVLVMAVLEEEFRRLRHALPCFAKASNRGGNSP